jgi:type III secretion protein R
MNELAQASPADPLLLLTVLIAVGLLPFVALSVTAFTKIVVVLGLVRQALGVQQIPPNMVLNGIAMILSAYIMAPIATKAYDTLVPAFSESKQFGRSFSDMPVIAQAIKEPLQQFLTKHSEPKYRLFFVRSTTQLWPEEAASKVKEDDLLVLIPSFTLTELTEAFQIGFLLYLAFIAVDLVVGTILMALGMQMVSPNIVSIPFKLMLFVAVDGWTHLIQGLVLTYR